MKAMIMAAGLGTRLMPLTKNVPKTMIPMGNRPLMENTIRILNKYHFNEIIVNVHGHGSVIKDCFGDGKDFGVAIQYSPEEKLKGTAGGVKHCQWFLDGTFAVLSGDALTDINLNQLLQIHKKKGALATMALKEVTGVERFGIVMMAEDGRIERFQEKPHPEAAYGQTANTGIYIFEPEIFDYIPLEQFHDFGKQLFPHLITIKAPLFGTVIDEYWCDVGDFSSYCQGHRDILTGKIEYEARGEMLVTPEAIILEGDNCDIAEDVLFSGMVVLGSGCVVRAGAEIKDTVIWNHTIIKEQARLNECIIGNNCWVGQGAKIRPGAVIASDCRIENRVEIPERLKVFNSIG